LACARPVHGRERLWGRRGSALLSGLRTFAGPAGTTADGLARALRLALGMTLLGRARRSRLALVARASPSTALLRCQRLGGLRRDGILPGRLLGLRGLSVGGCLSLGGGLGLGSGLSL